MSHFRDLALQNGYSRWRCCELLQIAAHASKAKFGYAYGAAIGVLKTAQTCQNIIFFIFGSSIWHARCSCSYLVRVVACG